MSWDLNVCMQHWDRVLIPFHYFVKPVPQIASLPLRLRFPFLRLPTDLQLVIYECCDAPTLFQLMRTCSRTRLGATKLFWNKTFSNQWYHCPDYWLFDHHPRSYTFLPYCPEFAHCITNVEIDLIRLELHFRQEDEDGKYQASTAKAEAFWIKVEKIFPSITDVVLTGCTPRKECPPPPGELDEDYTIIETVVKCAPAGVKVKIGFMEFPNLGRTPPRNFLWQPGSQAQSGWRLLDQDWKPNRVLLPGRKWKVSPLGDFLRFQRQYHLVLLEMRGIQWLMIETYVRYAIQDIIHCPRLDCSEAFLDRPSWTQHLSESNHGRFEIRNQSENYPMLQLFCYKHTPESERIFIEARQQRMNFRYSEAEKIQRRVGYGWGPPGSEQRRLFEQEFKAQMEEENLFTLRAPGPDQRDPVEEFVDNLYMYFDRDHVYHGGCSGPTEAHICYGE